MITSPGIGSGLDIESLVVQLVAIEGQAPAGRLDRREAAFQAELSGLGTFRAALDSFRSALDPLKDLSQFAARTARSSDEEVFTVAAGSTVAPGDYEIEVLSLARAHKLTSGAFADAGTYVGTGTLTISLDPTAANGIISIDLTDPAKATLADIRNAINEAPGNPGVAASIVNAEDGAHLVLTGTKTGEANSITVTATGGDGGLDALVYDPGGTTNLTEVHAAADAEILIDSFTHKSATNVVSGVIDGLSLTLVGENPGTPATLSIGLDRGQARTLVEDFVTAYNGLLTTARELTSYDAESQVAGLLQGDSIVPSLTDRLSRVFNQTVPGTLTSLRDLGVSVGLDGKLEIDQTKHITLDEVLNTNFGEVGDLFADKTNGIAVRFDALLDEYLKADGLLDVRSDGLQSSIERIAGDRERLDLHLAAVEQRIRKQFLALDSLISQLNGTSGFLSAQLANLPSPAALLGK